MGIFWAWVFDWSECDDIGCDHEWAHDVRTKSECRNAHEKGAKSGRPKRGIFGGVGGEGKMGQRSWNVRRAWSEKIFQWSGVWCVESGADC